MTNTMTLQTNQKSLEDIAAMFGDHSPDRTDAENGEIPPSKDQNSETVHHEMVKMSV
jgi:hypothetical protein